MGLFQLLSSKIFVSIPVSFMRFKDDRFVEKIGYTPKIKTPPGTDALDSAKDFLSEKFQEN